MYTHKVGFAKQVSILTVFLLLLAAPLAALSVNREAPSSSNKNVEGYTLENGLKVFTSENHSVPLVYIEIAVRAGGVTQTPETAGMFHLYEHMMFKGNELYRDAASVQKAINDMGVTNWNGTTSPDCVNYFFTIPKDQLENGLAFWNAAIRSPLMDPKELENEKKVVLSEIEGGLSDPSTVLSNYLRTKLFPDAPYRCDAAGSSEVVKNATVAQLRDMQSKYYIPCNAALFVGGDINSSEVHALAKKIWGSWTNNGNKAPAKQPQQSLAPFSKPLLAVMPYDKMTEQLADVEVYFRGPDADYNLEDVYASDYLENLMDDPDGSFAQGLVADGELEIPDSAYVWGGGSFNRAMGMFSFGAVMLEPEKNLPARTEHLLSKVQDEILPAMAADPSLYTAAKVKDIVRKLSDSDIVSTQTAEGILSQVRSAWLRATPDFYYNYNSRMGKVTQADVQSFVGRYVSGKAPLVLVLVNPSVYQKTRQAFAAKGYEVISADNAFWWKNRRYAPDPAKLAQETAVPDRQDIYVPSASKKSSYKLSASRTVDRLTLKNGIPVYVLRDAKSRIATVSIAVRGGVDRLTPQTSGLESALFSMMADSSANYDYTSRKTISFDNQSSIASTCKVAGSYLTLSSIDTYLYDMIPVLTDGFVNPDFNEQLYSLLMNSYSMNVQRMLNDPEELLDYAAYKELYKGHPFESQTSVTPDSIGNITVENMMALHRKVLNAQNIFVFVSGNISSSKLVSELNKTLGLLESDASEVYKPHSVPPASIGGKDQVLTHQSAQGTGYAQRVFAGPTADSADYIPAVIASKIYSTILFNVVREHHGACYTPSSMMQLSRAPTGGEYIFKISDTEHFVSYVKEARDYMASGKVIDSVGEDGSYIVSDIKDELESYRNSYIVSTYSGQRTAAAVAGQLVYNLLSYDDMAFSDKLNAQVLDLDAEAVVSVFKKYWCDADSQWWIMVGPELKDKVKF
ncbi:MAG: insulinase family protein [Treponema sp.]|nr:insulinase family protein [Treponema sp.]